MGRRGIGHHGWRGCCGSQQSNATVAGRQVHQDLAGAIASGLKLDRALRRPFRPSSPCTLIGSSRRFLPRQHLRPWTVGYRDGITYGLRQTAFADFSTTLKAATVSEAGARGTQTASGRGGAGPRPRDLGRRGAGDFDLEGRRAPRPAWTSRSALRRRGKSGKPQRLYPV
jgi:hypothetical protein